MIIRQLTNNNISEHNLQISGKNIIWSARSRDSIEYKTMIFDYGFDSIYFYDHNSNNIIPLTHNTEAFLLGSNVIVIKISDNDIAWIKDQKYVAGIASVGHRRSLYYYDKEEITGLESNLYSQDYNQDYSRLFDISGNKIVITQGAEIYLYDGTEKIEIGEGNNQIINSNPSISGNNIVWQRGDGDEAEIYFYDGIDIKQLTNNNVGDYNPQISGDNVVWQRGDSNEAEIYFYDGIDIKQLTNNDREDYSPQISGNNVIWQRGDGDEAEIYFYDGIDIKQLTNNNVEDYNPQISGDNVVWQRGYGNDAEIFAFNGSRIIKLTDNNVVDYSPKISGDNIVWQQTINGSAEPNSSEIFTTSLVYTTEKENESYLYRFRNIELNTGTYLFVNDTEANAILANPIYDHIFELEGYDGTPFSDTPAFKVSTQPREDLIGIYRLRNKAINGTYLFVTEGEYNQIFADNSPYKDLFIPEGTDENGIDVADFYVYGAGSNQGISFYRLRNLQNNTYLFAGESETNTIVNDPYLSSIFVNEGEAFKGLI